MDRRAQATYVSLSAFLSHRAPVNSDVSQANKKLNSTLLSGPRPQFASRYSGPNHPANSGSIIALVTGGKFHGLHAWQDSGRGLGFGGFDGEAYLVEVYLGGKRVGSSIVIVGTTVVINITRVTNTMIAIYKAGWEEDLLGELEEEYEAV